MSSKTRIEAQVEKEKSQQEEIAIHKEMITYLCQKTIMYWRWHSHIEPPTQRIQTLVPNKNNCQ